MPDDVEPAEKTWRFLELERVQRSLQERNLQRYLGQTVSVLAEKVSAKSNEDLTGHSTCHRVVNFRGTDDMLGNIIDVRVTKVKANSLFGEAV